MLGTNLVLNNDPCLVLLNETKLTKDYKDTRWRSFQTPHQSKGGVWTGTTRTCNQHTPIRILGNLALWPTAAIRGIRVHCLNAYSASDSDAKKEYTWIEGLAYPPIEKEWREQPVFYWHDAAFSASPKLPSQTE